MESNIVEIGVPLDVNAARVEAEKGDTYTLLVIGLQRLYLEYKFQTIKPVVIGATGIVTRNLTANLAKLRFGDLDINTLVFHCMRISRS